MVSALRKLLFRSTRRSPLIICATGLVIQRVSPVGKFDAISRGRRGSPE